MTDSYVYSMGGPGRASRPSDFTGILMELLVDERVQPGWTYAVHADARLDAVLNVDGARREDFGEVLGHVGMLDGVL